MVQQLFWLSCPVNHGSNSYQGTSRSKQCCQHNLFMVLLGPAYSRIWPETRTTSDNCKHILPNLWQEVPQLLNSHWTFLNAMVLVHIKKIHEHMEWAMEVCCLGHGVIIMYNKWALLGKHILSYILHEAHVHKNMYIMWKTYFIIHYTWNTCTQNTWTLYGNIMTYMTSNQGYI